MIRGLLLLTIIISVGCSGSSSKKDRVYDEMVLIPQGTFTMGGRSEQAYQDEFPRHDVHVSSFYMDKYEVTNADFSEFVKATAYKTVAERDVNWEEVKKQFLNLPIQLQAGSLVFQKTDRSVNLQDYSQWWKWTIGADWKSRRRLQRPIFGKESFQW